MTNIIIGGSGNKRFLMATGHAGDARACAGISTLCDMVCGMLELMEQDGQVSRKETLCGDGAIYAECEAAACGRESVDTLLMAALVGAKQLAAQYPENICVTLENGEKPQQ